jgi:peroxiredoxin
VAQYAQYGIDLEEASGHDHHQLPVPSVFLVEAGGVVRWVYSNPDYKVRPDNAGLLEAARALAGR